MGCSAILESGVLVFSSLGFLTDLTYSFQCYTYAQTFPNVCL